MGAELAGGERLRFETLLAPAREALSAPDASAVFEAGRGLSLRSGGGPGSGVGADADELMFRSTGRGDKVVRDVVALTVSAVAVVSPQNPRQAARHLLP